MNMKLKNHVLIAMPALQDPNFSRSVTLICEHDEQGAIGLVLNRPLGVPLGDLFAQLAIDCHSEDLNQRPVMAGGPENGFVLHRPAGSWQSSLPVGNNIGLTSSIDILQAIAGGNGPSEAIVALGYAGWAAGLLEHEMAMNAWLTHPADADMLFATPSDKLWEAAAQAMGIDFNRLSSDTGHA